MMVLYWGVIVVGCTAIGFITGKLSAEIRCGKMLARLEAMGILKYPEDNKNDSNGI